MKKAETKIVRCAIYTRKSLEDSQEMAFNSIDAQRDAAESYIASQKGNGWICLPERYDDYGYSGGNLDRPALQRLKEDIIAGKIDMITTYRLDRLSRSLLDFGELQFVMNLQILLRKKKSKKIVVQSSLSSCFSLFLLECIMH